MARLIIYALLIYLGYIVLKSLVRTLLTSEKRNTSEAGSGDPELIKDPQCGAYFLKQRGIAGRVEGKTFYFCSEACRDKYLQEHE